MTNLYDLIIIGGGIVGASTAMQFQQRNPEKKVLLLEKESSPAQHQTGHNSGVVHAGVYYAPGSLKADFCKRGATATIEFCKQHMIPFEQCGKLIVATQEDELKRLEKLFSNCLENGLKVEWLTENQLKEKEPNIEGIRGFLVPESGITDYPAITRTMLKEFVSRGGEVMFDQEIMSIKEANEDVEINSSTRTFRAKFLICCGGLQADRLARMTGLDVDFQIVPFKGEYFRLPSNRNEVVSHLIYPVPDPEMPFLGVHLTRMIDGSVTVGPNAVLGFDREGYKKLSINLKDTYSMLTFGGFWRVILSNLKSGLQEMKNSLYKPGYLKLVNRYCPSIIIDELEQYPPGVRAQAVMANGDLVHDFLFKNSKRSLHVCNAPSPAATSAIPIGEHICDKIHAMENA